MLKTGWVRHEVKIQARGLAMHGYGQPNHTAMQQRTPLYARAFSWCDAEGRRLFFCCLDLGYITYAMRQGVVAHLQQEWGSDWSESSLLLSCTHTHSGPGGCAHEALYNLVTPGFVEAHVEAIVTAAVGALLQARAQEVDAEVTWVEAAFALTVPVAWNRSLHAWSQNPESFPCTDKESERAIDRHMRLLTFSAKGQVGALISFFGVHATCLGNTLHAYDADNKGYAATATEAALGTAAALNPPVAVFAQGTAGDVSPYYHGPGAWRQRSRMTEADEIAYAQKNGLMQSQQALNMASMPGTDPGAVLDSLLMYVDFSQVTIDPDLCEDAVAATTRPAHGVSFFAGTPVDGRGIAPALAAVLRVVAAVVKKQKIGQGSAADRAFYAAQGVKAVLLDAGAKQVLGQPLERLKTLPGVNLLDPLVAELKRQLQRGAIEKSLLVPQILPVQILRMGRLAWIACPGEFTTIAGQRLLATVRPVLASAGMDQLVLITYCNEYMGYVTTREEYEVQAYEGGHTLYGQWTLAAFQTVCRRLAQDFIVPPAQRTGDYTVRPTQVPLHELELRKAQ